MIAKTVASLLLCSLVLPAHAQEQAVTVVENVRVFDGKSGQLSGPSHVLLRGNRIERISKTPIPTDRRAAVEAAASIQRSIAAGVKCIEHGHLMDEATARLMAQKGIWLSMQVFPDEMANAFPPS